MLGIVVHEGLEKVDDGRPVAAHLVRILPIPRVRTEEQPPPQQRSEDTLMYAEALLLARMIFSTSFAFFTSLKGRRRKKR